ncbi:MAG TPA: HlyD family secretion protein [Bradyrhizobium sp.]|nr:HlyD family secretion protein [Bradyrhizobium sp.]
MSAAAAVLIVIALAAAARWYLASLAYETTDDAFIDSRPVSISSQVGGAIVDVPVTDNQVIEAGGVLARIDERDYLASLDQAKAQVDQANAGIVNYKAQLDEQQAHIGQAAQQVDLAQAALTFARQQYARYQTLAQRQSGSVEQAQQDLSNLQQAQATLLADQAALEAAKKQTSVLEAQVQGARGQLEQARASQQQAETNLSRTTITAPVAGRVTKLTAAKGAYAQVGQALMIFVPREMWITANFKETQLTEMRPRQPVEVTIDAYPGRTFAAHVDSIQAGSGTVFSLLPAENATGNYVKVLQRVPVKIVFDKPPDAYIGPGMSVEPSVKIR